MPRFLTGLILFAALLVRLVVPQGYMIDSSSGSLAIVICTSDTVAPMPAAQHGHAAHAHGHHAPQDESPSSNPEHQPCAYAGFATMDGPPPPLVLPRPAATMGAFAGQERSYLLPLAARRLPPARAPPVTA